MLAALLVFGAMQAAPLTLDQAVQPYRECVLQAAYYTAQGNEPLADAAALAVQICENEKIGSVAALAQTRTAEDAMRELNAWASVLKESTRAVVFRVRTCRSDLGCNAFMDTQGIPNPGPYRRRETASPPR